MRQVVHKLVGVLFWALLILLWFTLVIEHKAGRTNIAYSVQYLAVVAGAVLAVTIWWIRHNTRHLPPQGPACTGRPESAAHRRGPARPAGPLAARGRHAEARATGHLVVDARRRGQGLPRRR